MTLRELWEHPTTRWLERLFWAGVTVFVLIRLWPQLAALTGLPSASPVLGSTPDWSAEVVSGAVPFAPEGASPGAPGASSEDTLSSDALRGRVVVVNFWATWCGPCRLEMPALQSLWEEHRGDGLVVVGLSGDAGGTDDVLAFLEERDITYPVAMATAEHRRAFGGIPGFPTTFLIDRDGVVRNRVYGYFVPPAMNAAVRRLLEDDSAL